ncbi:acyltransferase family protein [Streptomyces xantholiticus]|uniref:acyltransferase family protein n=1 Tax=Streptomyces xantholiticus TaxID=68285 RepID=UPI001673E9EB|nr:acyltransferase [Streptomyces xantholiticus]GGW23431.1 acyltransferase [Streptomyces xantholiticus]
MKDRAFRTLDGIRGVAALCIVVLHSHRYFGDPLPSAQMAVDLFFVLSGFVLAHAYEERFREGMSPWRFMLARYVRLYPVYLLGTILGLVQALCMMRYQGQEVMENHPDQEWTWSQLLVDLPFAALMLPDPFAAALFPLNGIMWSIFFELLANLVWVLSRRLLESTKVLVGVVLVSGVLFTGAALWWDSTALGVGWDTFAGGLARVLYSFMLGVLLHRFHRAVRAPRIHPLLLLGVLPALAAFDLSTISQLCCALVVLPLLVLLGAKAEPQGATALLCTRLGLASYAVYALHKRLYMLSCGILLQFFGLRVEQYAPWGGLVFLVLLVSGCVLLADRFETPARRALSRRLIPPLVVTSKVIASPPRQSEDPDRGPDNSRPQVGPSSKNS